jgi:hypothetical protein
VLRCGEHLLATVFVTLLPLPAGEHRSTLAQACCFASHCRLLLPSEPLDFKLDHDTSPDQWHPPPGQRSFNETPKPSNMRTATAFVLLFAAVVCAHGELQSSGAYVWLCARKQ